MIIRITKKQQNGFYELTKGNEYYGWEDGIRLVQILGQLEDLLERHRIENIDQLEMRLTLVERKMSIAGIEDGRVIMALQQGFFKRRKTGSLIYVSPNTKIDTKNKCFKTTSYNETYFKDYGKTWALTKEELE